MRIRTLLATTTAAATALALTALPAAGDPPLTTYEVTITNLTQGQPLSPVVAVTHRPALDLFDLGDAASDAVLAIAEDGDAAPAAALAAGSRHTTDVQVGAPIAPLGVRDGAPVVATSRTFTIQARPGDRLTLAQMLICTNDGFTGLDSVRLPRVGGTTFRTAAYDAGTERNTEASEDLVDPCSALGPVVLDGDPDGNRNTGLDESGVVTAHPGVDGTVGDLVPAHDWDGAVTEVRVAVTG